MSEQKLATRLNVQIEGQDAEPFVTRSSLREQNGEHSRRDVEAHFVRLNGSGSATNHLLFYSLGGLLCYG